MTESPPEVAELQSQITALQSRLEESEMEIANLTSQMQVITTERDDLKQENERLKGQVLVANDASIQSAETREAFDVPDRLKKKQKGQCFPDDSPSS
jgi:predicted nuclease with TOPRIM domain